jgi:hypothetical protein
MGLMDDAKRALADKGAQAGAPSPAASSRQVVEYDVVEVREKLLDGRGSAPTDKLRSLLNERARDGWVLRTITSAEVAGMIGKRDGFIIVFERSLR